MSYIGSPGEGALRSPSIPPEARAPAEFAGGWLATRTPLPEGPQTGRATTPHGQLSGSGHSFRAARLHAAGLSVNWNHPAEGAGR